MYELFFLVVVSLNVCIITFVCLYCWPPTHPPTGTILVHCLWHVSLFVTRFTICDTFHCLWYISLFVVRFTVCDTFHCLWYVCDMFHCLWYISLFVICFTVCDMFHCLWHVSLFVIHFTVCDTFHCLWPEKFEKKWNRSWMNREGSLLGRNRCVSVSQRSDSTK